MDIGMPVMDGFETTAILTAEFPAIKSDRFIGL